MANLQIRVRLPYRTGLPGDYTVNTWSVISGSASNADIHTAFVNFYTDTGHGQSADLCHYLSQALSRSTNAGNIEQLEVDLTTGLMTAAWDDTFTLNSPGSASVPMPQEVAICTSFAAGGGLGVDPRRRRGRVYIGPLNTLATGEDGTNGTCVLNDSISSDLSDSTKGLRDDLVALGAELCVWSRADQGMYPVVHGWIDNEFDTQRRRGIDSTHRFTWM